MSSIRSDSPPVPAAVRSLEQQLSEAESPARNDLDHRSEYSRSPRDQVSNTLSFSPGDSGRGGDTVPVIHGGSDLLGSRMSMQNVQHAFSDESSGGHELDDENLQPSAESHRGGVMMMSSARTLGRDSDSERPAQRTHSREIATQTPADNNDRDGGRRSPPQDMRESVSPHVSPEAPHSLHQEQHHHTGGVRRVGPRIHGQEGAGQLWMVDSDHREDVSQVRVCFVRHSFVK